ncbi:MAG TPA: hypothetical protein PKO16_00025 [Bacteroidia bacterium]|nr:hypothetical protein [Bacteroidia bacterium]
MKKFIVTLMFTIISVISYSQVSIIGGSNDLQVKGGSPNSVSSIRWFKKNRPVSAVDTTSWAHYKFVGTKTAGSKWVKAGTVSTGFKVYRAVITQSSTSAPTVTVLNANDGNYLGDVTWSYTSAGTYTGTFGSAVLTSGKTFVEFDTPIDPVSATVIKIKQGIWATTSTVTVKTNLVNITTPAVTATNGYLSGDLIEIVVFD